MADHEKVQLLEMLDDKYEGTALDPDQVATELNCTRRYVDKLLDEGKLHYFVLDPDKQRKEKRVTKATLIAFMTNKPNSKEE